MKKIYLFLMAAMMMVTAVNAQTNGYNRLKNQKTGHFANLASSGSFAPNVDEESAYGIAGTVAYMEFDENRVTQLRLQGIDVVNMAIPMMKAMLLTIIDEAEFLSMRDTMVEMVKKQMSGAMGSMVARMMEDYTYEEFVTWVNTIDTNLYKEKNGDGFRLFMVTPPFPLNAGTFNDYLTTKANSFMKTYTGTLQEMADGYLTGGREGLRPMAYSFISHIKFDNRMYLTEQTIDDVIQFGFANDDDVSKASALWTFVPVDNDANYFGIVPEVEDANGNGYSTFVADFPIKLAEGMQAYYVTDEMDPANSQVKWQKVEDEKIPAKTPVIIQLKGKSAADNKVQLLDENYSYSLSDNALRPVANDMGFLLGRVLDEPDPNIYVLDVKDGKVCLASSTDNVLRANTAYLYVESSRKDQNPSGCLFFVDEVNGISEVTSENSGQAPCYDLQGRRVSHPTKGLFIINGKKVVY